MTARSDVFQWHALGSPPPQTLIDTRLALHWAAQIAADAGRTFNAPQDDDSHTNLEWSDALSALVRPLESDGVRAGVGLRLADATLLLTSPHESAAEYALDGRSLEDGYAWMEAQLTGLGFLRSSLHRTPHRPSEHPFSSGEPLRLDAAAAQELSHWYANAAGVIGRTAHATPGASTVRCWPHHFDLATLIEAAPGHTVGVGMTPGDGSYPEPYWYVTPYPYPESPSLGPLEGGGHWHREGWFGAVLRGNTLVETATGEGQHAHTDRFLASAVAASRRLLEP